MTTSSIIPSPGDVITVNFVFLQGGGAKIRPAVVLSSRPVNERRGYFIFSPLTGSAGSEDPVVEIQDLGPAGLNRRSYSRGVLFSTANQNILSIRGRLSSQDLARLRNLIKEVLLL